MLCEFCIVGKELYFYSSRNLKFTWLDIEETSASGHLLNSQQYVFSIYLFTFAVAIQISL